MSGVNYLQVNVPILTQNKVIVRRLFQLVMLILGLILKIIYKF